MEKPRAGNGSDNDGRGAPPLGRERRSGPRVIVVLDKPKELGVIRRIRTQVQPPTLCILVLQAVVESLVVTEVKALLLKLPFEIPVSLGYKEKSRGHVLNGRNDLAPILLRRRLPDPAPPRALENSVQQKHRHVTSDS